MHYVQLGIIVLTLNSMLRGYVQVEQVWLEELFLAVVEIENELAILDLDLKVGLIDLLLGGYKVNVSIAIDFHLVRHFNLLQSQINWALFPAFTAKFSIDDCFSPVSALVFIAWLLLSFHCPAQLCDL